MNPVLLKSLIGVGIVGGGTGLAISGYHLFKYKTVKDSLSSEEGKFLSFDVANTAKHDTEWKAKVTAYKSESEKPKLSEVTLSSTTDNPEDIKKLKEACLKLLSSENSESNISLFKVWCMQAN